MDSTQWLIRISEATHRPRGLMGLMWSVLVLALIAGVGWLVHATGGIMYVYSHTIYIPILLAAMVFGIPGALLAAVLGGLVLGPWMPLDVASGTPQQTLNWIYRIGILSMIALVAGGLFQLLNAQLDRFRRIAFEDAETDLPNRHSLELAVERALERMREITLDKQRIYVATVKLTNFNEIVNTLGMNAGRDLINAVSGALSDLETEQVHIFRMHSDSFGFLMSGVHRRDCYNLVRKALDIVESPQLVDDVPVQLECHVGIAAFPYHETDDPEMLIRKSVMALQSAEESGKPWSTYDRKQDHARRRTLALLGALRPAIENDELELHYQPKVCMAEGKPYGMEALLRWRRDGELIPPGDFIPAAESSGLIHPLTMWVVEAAAEQLTAWSAKGIRIPVAVNISGRNLLDDGFLNNVRELIENYGIEAGMLAFELTENSLYSDVQGGIEQLNTLRGMGITLSIDDFGTGYSSLSSLRRLPVEELKLDRSFVSRITREQIDRDIVASSIQIARSMGMRTVAEGVEDAATVEMLVELQCDIGQGYHFARPMPAGDATDWIVERMR